jgi:hypothetical protein
MDILPWYFEGLTDHKMALAWKQIMDPKGFYAPFGPTTAEQRHPGFKVNYLWSCLPMERSLLAFLNISNADWSCQSSEQ